jgi:hypothetical protein
MAFIEEKKKSDFGLTFVFESFYVTVSVWPLVT